MKPINIIQVVCRITISKSYIDDRRRSAERSGLIRAIRDRDTKFLFGWLVEVLSFQGISDSRASAYMDGHGRLTFADVKQALRRDASCPRLQSFWHFEGCGFKKLANTCAEPELLESCPLPRHDLRNGRLNQTAYALFLFIRDVCQGDPITWIDDQLAEADDPHALDRAAVMRDALLVPSSQIYGASFKVLSMAFAELLLAGAPSRERWATTSASMIAIDTLVHNWLYRTGIMRQLGTDHPYGMGCYAPGGCASIIEACSHEIDARHFCPDGPAKFPRLVQHAIWMFCAESGVGICNGNRINDRVGCMQIDCPLFSKCEHLPPR